VEAARDSEGFARLVQLKNTDGADIRSCPKGETSMRIATRTPFIRPTAPRIVLAVLCIVSLMVLTQCTMTADKVTGVDLAGGGISPDKVQPQTHGSCVSECAHQANDAMQAEKDLHQNNVQACNSDPTCLANEEDRHEAAVEAIQEARQHCMDGCHHQGGGHGGR
jgi:hypothetical protein